MGEMLVQYQRMNGEGGNFTEDRYGSGRALNYLLQVRPNPLMTASQLQEQVEYRKILRQCVCVYRARHQRLAAQPLALHRRWLRANT